MSCHDHAMVHLCHVGCKSNHGIMLKVPCAVSLVPMILESRHYKMPTSSLMRFNCCCFICIFKHLLCQLQSYITPEYINYSH